MAAIKVIMVWENCCYKNENIAQAVIHIQNMGKFVWDERKPRFKNSILQQSRDQGGLAFPDKERYYQAAMLNEYIVQWWEQSKRSWDIEQMSLKVPLKKWCLLAGTRKASFMENRILKIL